MVNTIFEECKAGIQDYNKEKSQQKHPEMTKIDFIFDLLDFEYICFNYIPHVQEGRQEIDCVKYGCRKYSKDPVSLQR